MKIILLLALAMLVSNLATAQVMGLGPVLGLTNPIEPNSTQSKVVLCADIAASASGIGTYLMAKETYLSWQKIRQFQKFVSDRESINKMNQLDKALIVSQRINDPAEKKYLNRIMGAKGAVTLVLAATTVASASALIKSKTIADEIDASLGKNSQERLK